LPDRLDQNALFGIAGGDGGPGVAALEQSLARIQQQTALHLRALLAVALVTVVRENGADLILKKFETRRIIRRPRRHRQNAHRNGDAKRRAKRQIRRCRVTFQTMEDSNSPPQIPKLFPATNTLKKDD